MRKNIPTRLLKGYGTGRLREALEIGDANPPFGSPVSYPSCQSPEGMIPARVLSRNAVFEPESSDNVGDG
jgi:hypothetical protein